MNNESINQSTTTATSHNTHTHTHTHTRIYIYIYFEVVTGMLGFYFIPGLIVKDAKGDRIIISFYCTIMTLTT